MSAPSPSTRPGISLERDAKGRIVRRVLNLGQKPEIRRYAYDAAGRLARVADDTGALRESYQYDHEGRRLADINPARFRGERRYAYAAGNRLSQAGQAQFRHDAAGFRSLKIDGDAETRFHYEPSGLLLAVDLPDGKRIEYAYDSSGLRREKRVVGRLVEAYLWLDPLRLLEFFDGDEWWRLAYDSGRPGRGSRTPIGLTSGTASYLIVSDHLGTPLALANLDGSVVQVRRYDSFSNLLEQSGATVRLPLGFAGGLFDADTGLTRFVWRDYDADTGRFTALDPLGAKGGDDDWYGYCVDDPVNRVDAWGLKTFSVGGSVSGTGFGVGGTASGSIGKDSEGGWSMQGSVGAGPAAGYGASIGGFGQYTNATRMDELAGKGTQVGWSFGDLPIGQFKVGRGYGVDKVMGETYEGVSVQGGLGAGTPEAHAYETYTWSQDLPVPDFHRGTPPDDFDLYNRD